MLPNSLREALPGHDPKVRRHVLPEYQYPRAQHHHPQQMVTEVRSRRDVGRPIAGVDEADGDEEAGAKIGEHLPEKSSAHSHPSGMAVDDRRLNDSHLDAMIPETALIAYLTVGLWQLRYTTAQA